MVPKIDSIQRLRVLDGERRLAYAETGNVLTIIMVLLLTVTAIAVTPRGVIVTPTLSYDGTTALCEVIAAGNTENDIIYAGIKLMHGNEVIKSRHPSATGILDFYETVE